MTDGDALRRAVVADPDDDTPRLVYADWLDENGDPDRAAFVRAQVEAVRADPFGLAARTAADRATRLLEQNRMAWTRHLRGGFADRPRFERGFVAHLSVEPVAFVPAAAALFDSEPVQGLKLFRFAGPAGRASFGPFFDLTHLRRVRRLELSSGLFTEEEYADLCACPHLAGVRELSLRDNPVQPRWLSDLICGDRFPELAGLDVAEIPHLRQCLADSLPEAVHRDIRRLDLSGVVFTSDLIQRVLGSRCLRRVEELRLACTARDGDPGPLFHLDLGFVIPWERLIVLNLSGQGVGDPGVREIVGQKEAGALRWLGLAYNGLGPDAIRALAESKHLALNYLDVSGNGLSIADVAALQRRFPDAVIANRSFWPG